MISPEEIRRIALKWWRPLLESYIRNESFFPRPIERIGKVQPGQVTGRFERLHEEIGNLYQFSKNETGRGYQVITAGRNFRHTGSHELPEAVVFETTEDYIHFVGKSREWKTFRDHYEIITGILPELRAWTLQNSLWLTQPVVDWADILKVCCFFMNTPRPDMYLRQLPIEIHTKFIEGNEALIRSLLDFLIPDHIRAPGQKRFAERYFLKYDEPLVRIRVLGEKAALCSPFTDISIPLSDFQQTPWPAANILIAENKMNFLALPPIPSTIALWSGGGFNISYLKNATWLQRKKIFYWGDLDEHGFQILHQLRNYYPDVESLMMDRGTFEKFKEYRVTGPHCAAETLDLLTGEEAAMFRYLKTLDINNRLEQEKISQSYAAEAISRACAII